MDYQRLQRLLAPKSIAVFGTQGADFAISESQKLGFDGPIYAVHPTRDHLAGLPCYQHTAQLPQAPDAAYVAVNAEAAITIVAELNAMGAGGAVLYAAGFSEVGDAGMERQQRLLEAAGNMPIIGPNCYGVINALDKAVLWPDQHGLAQVDQGVGIITQSGNIGLNMTMQQIGLPIAYMFTMGNQAQVDIAHIVDAMLSDPRVNAIGLHIEGINDLPAFDAAARRALAQQVPIVAIKSGRTAAAAQIALSHTSSLTGSDQLFDALFERLGIVRVNTVPEFLETLKLLSLLGPLPTNRIASMSCSGGEAGMMADLADNTCLHFASLTKPQQQAVQATLNDYVEVSNPLDYHTFIWGNRAAMTNTFSAMMAAEFGATMLLLDWPNYSGADPTQWDNALLALADAAKLGKHQAIVLSSMAECLPAHAIALCQQHGVIPMIGLDTCLQALHSAYRVQQAFDRPLPKPLSISHPATTNQTQLMTEYEAKQALKAYGLPIPTGHLVSSTQQAIAAAQDIGYPVTIKAVSESLSHKTEHHAVYLNISNQQELTSAASKLLQLAEQMLVERMETDVLAELIVGVNSDPLFGNYLLVGAGGILVELLQDSQLLLLPCTAKDVHKALQKLTIKPLLEGYRGQPPSDQQAIVDAIMAVLSYTRHHPVREMDINPLLVKADGCVAVDALISR
ncbi:MAG: acetate--CoA ligase family protein [Gammaproteobacteria bacterium]|jgi:acyl-CoA synthetase (NDP forming)|nr:acetate--CoA ligase family protein [Gammaproteobacteria bacterium]